MLDIVVVFVELVYVIVTQASEYSLYWGHVRSFSTTTLSPREMRRTGDADEVFAGDYVRQHFNMPQVPLRHGSDLVLVIVNLFMT